jgi:hypothetical protein
MSIPRTLLELEIVSSVDRLAETNSRGELRRREPQARTPGASRSRLSEYQRALKVDYGLCPDVLNPIVAACPEPIESQTVGLRVDQSDQSRPERGPLRRIDLAFEY